MVTHLTKFNLVFQGRNDTIPWKNANIVYFVKDVTNRHRISKCSMEAISRVLSEAHGFSQIRVVKTFANDPIDNKVLCKRKGEIYKFN